VRDNVDTERLAAIWREAAGDLGIDVAAPHILLDDAEAVTCVAWVKDFGSAAGTAVGVMHRHQPEVARLAKKLGLYVSFINPDVYRSFDRDLFIETLNDWGWFGTDGGAPSWYTGHTG
jgi:hypothetical protein